MYTQQSSVSSRKHVPPSQRRNIQASVDIVRLSFRPALATVSMAGADAFCCPVWIATIPANSSMSQAVASGHGRHVHTNLNTFAESAPQIQRDLEECNLDVGELESQHILGLALIKSDFVYDALHTLDAPQRLQYEFFQGLDRTLDHSSLYFFKLVVFVPLGFTEIVQRVNVRYTRTWCFRLEEQQPQRLLNTIAALQPLPHWVDDNGPPFVCLHLPRVYAYLLAMQHWKVFCLYDSPRPRLWKIGWAGHGQPPELTALRTSFPPWRDFAEEADPQALDVFSPHDMNSMLTLLRNFAGGVDPASADAPELLREAHKWALRMQQHADTMRNFVYDMGLRAWGQQQRRRREYDIYTLLECFFCADLLGNDSNLVEVLQHACKIVLPREQANMLLDSIQHGSARFAPDASQLSRMRLRIDVAFMFCMRQHYTEWLLHGRGVVLYPVVDASPQGGKDYEMVVLNIVEKRHLTELHDLTSTLEAFQYLSLEERLERFETEREIMARIETLFRWTL